jgi:hypothetical protein
MDHIVREAIENELHPNSINRDAWFMSQQIMEDSHLLPQEISVTGLLQLLTSGALPRGYYVCPCM